MTTVKLPPELWAAIVAQDEPNVLDLHQRSTHLTRGSHPLQDAYAEHPVWRTYAPEDQRGRTVPELRQAFGQRHALRTPQARYWLRRLTLPQKLNDKSISIIPRDVVFDFDIHLARLTSEPPSFQFYGGSAQADDKTLVLAAMRNGGGEFLADASARLRDDEDVVLAAVGMWGSALQYASDRLRDSERIVRVAYLDDPYSLAEASLRLRRDPAFLDALAASRPDFALLRAAADSATLSPKTLTRLAPVFHEQLASLALADHAPQRVAAAMGLPLAVVLGILGS